MEITNDHAIDAGIKDVVLMLNANGFNTIESCQGGQGHCFSDATVRFLGDEFDLIRAYELCKLNNINVYEAKRVYRKTTVYNNDIELGENWDKPFNELIFLPHVSTVSIYLRC